MEHPEYWIASMIISSQNKVPELVGVIEAFVCMIFPSGKWMLSFGGHEVQMY
jgi:hypothetical protein